MILGVPVESILTILAGAALGFAAHVLFKVGEINVNTDSSMTVWRYLSAVPHKTGAKALTVFLVSLYVAKDVDVAKDLATLEAFLAAAAIGYAADSAVNHFKR